MTKYLVTNCDESIFHIVTNSFRSETSQKDAAMNDVLSLFLFNAIETNDWVFIYWIVPHKKALL